MSESGSAKKRKVGDTLLEAIETARAELDERESNLEQREEALQKALEGVEHEKQLMAGCTPSDVVNINIGGTRLQMLRKTLCQHEGSMLAAQFSGRWDGSTAKDDAGIFFIDQPYETMLPLLNFLRAKAIETEDNPAQPPPDRSSSGMNDIYRLVEYYGMTQFVYQQTFKLHSGVPDTAVCVRGAEPSFSSTAWNSFLLEPWPDVHGRRVKSFSVVLGDSIERLQIGWGNSTWRESSSLGAPTGEGKGVGEDLQGVTIALYFLRRSVQFMGTSLKDVPDLVFQTGSVVTCERMTDRFRWLVDGAEVAVVLRTEIAAKYRHGSGPFVKEESQSEEPAISARGEARLSHFTY